MQLGTTLATLWTLVATSPGLQTNETELAIGILTAVTQKTYQFIPALAAWDIDFRKNFNASLRARFGPPIIQIPNLPSNMRIKAYLINTDGQPDLGIAGALQMFLGQNGYRPVNGLVGAHYSSVSTPIAHLGATLKQPQVSFGSTSPALSNKQIYSYFLRVVPPDSIQARALWKYINFFDIPAATIIYSSEPYGEGIFNSLKMLAQDNDRDRVWSPVALPNMPKNFKVEEARKILSVARAFGNKFFLILVSSQLLMNLLLVIKDEGWGAQYQYCGSESLVDERFQQFLPAGVHAFNPISKGAKYASFWKLWNNLQLEDYASEDTLKRWRVAAWDPVGGIFNQSQIKEDWFKEEYLLHPYMLFFFDAIYTYVMAFAKMLTSGYSPEAIKGEDLLKFLQGTDFEGVTGPIKFNEHGDRLADYDFVNLRPHRQGKAWVQAGRFSGTSDNFTLYDASKLLWMDGSENGNHPAHLTSCNLGYFRDSWGICSKCPVGSWANVAAATRCNFCGPGKYQNETGHTFCKDCPLGHAAKGPGADQCAKCAEGQFADVVGASACNPCRVGKFADVSGSQVCSSCASLNRATTTSDEGAFTSRQCHQCPAGSVTDGDSVCSPCARGTYADRSGLTACMICPQGMETLQDGAHICFWTNGYILSCISFHVLLFLSFLLCGLSSNRCIPIEDICLERERLVLNTAHRHYILKRQLLRHPCIILRNTGHRNLNGRFCYTVLTRRDLVIFTKDGEPMTRADASSGHICIPFLNGILQVGYIFPVIVWLSMLIAIAVVIILVMPLTWQHLLVPWGGSTVLCTLVLMWARPRWQRKKAWTTMKRLQDSFKKELKLHRRRPSVTRQATYNDQGPAKKGGARAISFGQLADFYTHFASFIRDRNMHYVCSQLVMQLTEECKLSFAEMVGASETDWFVSHSWGDRFDYFVSSIENHAQSAGQYNTSMSLRWHTYWICTFSNNQWQVKEELGSHWSTSSFYLALTSPTCKGTVMVLDIDASPLTRTWCLFELTLTFTLVRECQNPGECGSPDDWQGLIFSTHSGLLSAGKAPVRVVMALADKVAGLRLEDAKASNIDDTNMIHNYVYEQGGFQAVNTFMRLQIRKCLMLSKWHFEQDFHALISKLPEEQESVLKDESDNEEPYVYESKITAL